MEETIAHADREAGDPAERRARVSSGHDNTPEGDEDVNGLGTLVTRAGGRVPLSDNLRLKMAIFDSGRVYHVPGVRWTPDFKAAINTARGKGIHIHEFEEVDAKTLSNLYREETEDDIVLPELQRQQDLAEIIRRAAEAKASDIHIRILKEYTEVRIRVFGRLRDMTTRKAEDGMPMIKAAFAVASDTGNSTSDTSFQQGALTPRSGLLPRQLDMLRLQYTPESEGRGTLIMRLKYKSNAEDTDIDSLGYNPVQIGDINVMRKRTNGLYILAGKVSSGKTTTLQRILNRMIMEKNREISMYTIEEPVELELPNATQHPAKKLPDGTDGFLEAMKAALRSDLNVIVVGEIRSKMLADLAIQAVMTGHALWSTIHAGSALGILDRLSDFGVEPWKLQDPSVVRGLVYQRLCGVICPHCRVSFRRAVETGRMEADLAEHLADIFGKRLDDLYVRGPGCDKCSHMGLKGRTVVAETCLTDPRLLELFSEGRRMEMRKYWSTGIEEQGMGGLPVLHHALTKVGAGLCDIFEVEEEVDLVSSYDRDFSHLKSRIRDDIRRLEARS